MQRTAIIGKALDRRMRHTFTLALLTLLTMALGCSDDHSKAPAAEPTPLVLKVSVLADGAILLDGVEVSPLALRERFAEVVGGDAVVWYYREQGESEPPKAARLVVQAVIDSQLPISFSTEPDFSTVVTPDGTARPR